MKSRGLKSKVENLEQLKVEFDDTNNSDNTIPVIINSKSKYAGPSNNNSSVQTFKRKTKKAYRFRESGGEQPSFGFKDRDSNDEEETKDGGNHWSQAGLANRFF